jgi:tetratricopeptide (TPR) repeat protein
MKRGGGDRKVSSAASAAYNCEGGVDEESSFDNFEEEKKLDSPDVSSPSRQHQQTQRHISSAEETTPISRRSTMDFGRPTSTTRTKSWTDQRAPEPFSTPTQRPRRKKYGYGDLYGSTSGSHVVEDRIGYRHSYHASNKSKLVGSSGSYAYDRRRSTDANGTRNIQHEKQRQPSFSALDFPVLSPVKSKAASSNEQERSSSWSSVVCGQEEANHTRVYQEELHNIIPPLPFADDVVSKTIDESEPLDVPAALSSTNDLFDASVDTSRDYWKERHTHPRPRSQSVQYYPSGKQMHSTFTFSQVKVDNVPSPSTPFSMSIAALQNDIGTLFARTNRVDEAIERYKLSIESATDTLKGLKNKTLTKGGESELVISSISDGKMQQCPVKVSEGLAWFRTKLLRGDVAPATADTVSPTDNQNDATPPFPPPYQPAGFGGCAPSSPRRLRSASFCAFDLQPTFTRSHSHGEQTPTPLLQTTHSFRKTLTPHITPKPSIAPVDDIVQDIHQHQKLDCPEDVYSCSGRTPLGLEYICDPFPVLGRSLRSLIVGLSDEEARITIETAALVAATLNLAAMEYRLAGGGVSEKLQQVLETLQSCQSSFDRDEEGCVLRSNNFFVLLKAVAHVNIGTCLYRLNKVREATQNFERAQNALAEYNDDVDIDPEESACHSHDDDRFPPREYLLLVIRVNLSRAMLRLNKHEEAQKLCDQISDDNKPHRKNSSSRRLSAALPSRMYGFRRSSSFSATSSALETALAAYDHDIDRRSKWLFSVAEHFLVGLIHEARDEPNDQKEAWHHYNRLLSLARTKLDHRHPYICSLLERRGAVLFSQRKLQCSLLSYLACLHVLEHQQSNGSNVFNQADMARVLYGIARVLHDKEEYHDALSMYHRALKCQREVSINSPRPSLDVVTTLCNISRVHHLSGDLDAALSANKEVLELATLLVGGKMDHPFLIHRLKVEGNILVEAGRLEDAMRSFVEAARRLCEDGRNRMMAAMMGGGQDRSSNSQEDADAGDSSVLSVRSAATLAQSNCFHPGAAAA